MPLYMYNCQSCDAEFELLVGASDVPACPACGGEQLKQQVVRISREIRYPGVAKSWRRAAAASGDLSHFNASERKL